MSNLAPFFPFISLARFFQHRTSIYSESSKGGGQPLFWKGLQIKAVTNVECSKRSEVLKPQIIQGFQKRKVMNFEREESGGQGQLILGK